jgi:hypothetical protein
VRQQRQDIPALEGFGECAGKDNFLESAQVKGFGVVRNGAGYAAADCSDFADENVFVSFHVYFSFLKSILFLSNRGQAALMSLPKGADAEPHPSAGAARHGQALSPHVSTDRLRDVGSIRKMEEK